MARPQLPVCSSAQAVGFKFSGSQLKETCGLSKTKMLSSGSDVRVMRMFHSHAGIEQFKVEWNNQPLLLFADMEMQKL